MTFKIGDLVRTKQAVGIVDGELRGPGHHDHYQVVALTAKGQVIAEDSEGVERQYEPGQLEASTMGFYFAELLKEANHHLGWDTPKVGSIIQQLSPDNIMNLRVLDGLRDMMHAEVNVKFDYEDVAEGLFKSADPASPAEATDNLTAADPWAALAGNPDIVDAAVLTFAYPEGATTKMSDEAAAQIDTDLTYEKLLGKSEPLLIGIDPGVSEQDRQELQAMADKNAALLNFTPPISSAQSMSIGQEIAKEVLKHLERKEGTDFIQDSPGSYCLQLQAATPVFSPNETIPLSELAKLTGYKTDHLNKLIKREILPAGEKIGRVRYMPAQACIEILSQEKDKYGHWTKTPPVVPASVEAPVVVAPSISWDDLR